MPGPWQLRELAGAYVKGNGRCLNASRTVEMMLIFKLGRPDVLPVDDYGVRKGFAVTYRRGRMPKPAALLRHGERWRPYRSVASWYMWRALELARQVKPVGLQV